MTPLVDIVFQLVVFFLVASHLAQQETVLDLDLPAAQSGELDRPAGTARLVVNIPLAGEMVWVSGQSLDIGQLKRLLEAETVKRGRQLQVRLRCDRQLPFERLQPILAICAELGITDVTLATVESP